LSIWAKNMLLSSRCGLGVGRRGALARLGDATKMCGDNAAPEAMRTEKEAEELQEEAHLFVTQFVRVLFGAVSTTKMHRLAFHLLQELLLRGNLEEGDTGKNEMLHKMLKAMYRVTSKHPENVQVQMMRCEKTLLNILTEGADERLRDAERLQAHKCAADKTRRTRRKSGRSPTGTVSTGTVDDPDTPTASGDHETGYDASDESCDVSRIEDLEYVGVDEGVLEDQNVDADDSASDSAHGTCTSDEVYDEDTTDGGQSGSRASTLEGPRVLSRGADLTGASSSGESSSGSSPGSASSSSSATFCSASVSESASTSGSDTASGSTTSASIGVSASPATSKRGSKRTATPLTASNTRPAKRVRTPTGSTSRNHTPRKRVRIRGRRVSVAAVAAADGGRLCRFPTLRGLSGAQMLTVGNSTSLKAFFEWGAKGFQQRVRAARALYNGRPWWDHIRFKDAANPGKSRLGLVRLVIRAIDGVRRDHVFVQLLEASAREGCVLTDFGCAWHKLEIDPSSGFPALALVPTGDIQRLEHVVPDF